MRTRQVWPGWSPSGIISVWCPAFSEIVQAKPSQLQIPADTVSEPMGSVSLFDKPGIWVPSMYHTTLSNCQQVDLQTFYLVVSLKSLSVS